MAFPLRPPSSLSGSLFSKISERKSEVLLEELDDKDNIASGALAFQYFPESISDRKATEYVRKQIFGGALPIYQWTSGGARTISFKAVFSSDNDLLDEGVDHSKLLNNGRYLRNVDVRSAIIWLRQFTLPSYDGSGSGGQGFTQAPRKLRLTIPNSGIGYAGGIADQSAVGNNTPGTALNADSVLCLMTGCDVIYLSFFPSGLPRLVEVDLSFDQIAQIRGAVQFPQRTSTLSAIVTSGLNPQSLTKRGTYFPYNVVAKFDRSK